MRANSWAGALLACAMVLAAGQASAASPVPSLLTCPDEERIDIRQDRGRDTARVRDIAPKAGGRTSEELAALARLQQRAYDLYDVYDADGDLNAAFAKAQTGTPALRLVGFVFGDPGRDTERPLRRRARNTRTFYGLIADDLATGQRLIVIRGTLQPNEWLRNLQVRQTPFAGWRSGARVHAGFHTIFSSMEVEQEGQTMPLAQALPALAQGRQTVFVGHSLGGALAMLAGVEAGRLVPAEAQRIRVVTFGAPRVGDYGFASLAQNLGRIDRVCNLVDAVTAVPPSAGRIDYVHAGTLFAVSSFDWPQLDNQLAKPGDQILCWHSIYSYTYMLSVKKNAAEARQCAAVQVQP